MSSSTLFQGKLVSIMEILVNSAVTDICRLVDDGAAVLHFEISRSKSENENLRLKLQLMERELQTVRKAKKTVNSVGTQCVDLGGRQEISTTIKQEQHSNLQEEKGERIVALPQLIHGQLTNEPSLNHHQESITRHHRNANFTQVNSHQSGRPAEGPNGVTESNVGGYSSGRNCRSLPQSDTTHRDHSSLPLKSENKSSCEQDGKYDHSAHQQEVQPPYHQQQQQVAFSPSEQFSNLKDRTALSSDVCEVEYELNEEDCHQDGRDSRPTRSIQDVSTRHQTRLKQESDTEGNIGGQQSVHAPAPAPGSLDISPQCLYQTSSQLTFALHEATGCGGGVGGGGSATAAGVLDPSGPTAARPHVCPQCGRGFAHTHVLKRHLVVHSGLRPHPCGYCGKRFALRDSLRRHQRIHTGERPYGCHLCGKRFTQRTHLNIHLSVHTGIRPFTCTHCGRSFTQTHVLRRHMRVHAAEGLPFYQEDT
ncbi:zinc finger protein 467-like [Engraulis encrasicolus]|uniref:zinc finger protein 467-like n=1 Tax=Engraulis encrasicolus TaxID=184585 RepID=UPI002FD02EC4